ncbi:uncharacterized protein LOC129725703 [Wyeomyia smithii]|uniref:uncharacterized protein LOC129725703 n=1 Tax=Wyeomyia smithii TaxID=174621 RepID=UPI002467C378|nr:uncharacterized protein LOC129725703 [Wyeomyia smithii]XP_055537769.1 uncharacterized protein LOC129725703 [Wyeomyia smithii]XP_055537770.1 uncharacterized protein LOC129725703 [Wyeomyia smithii]XP_055537771.1 uncharacterized protein LOC129725703 [Wyeomyia smithii]XP_055537772.1 uncharacterized protein LOC129725703 [Wyeomyia smithii]
MGASNPPDQVVSACCFSHHSRSGFEIEVGNGVSQSHLSGKYMCVTNNFWPDSSPGSSSQRDDTSSSKSQLTTLGRTVYSILEALKPPDAVVHVVTCHQSRPGPAVEVGEGVLQLVFPGKYHSINDVFPPDASPHYSPPEHHDTVSATIHLSSTLQIYYQNVRGLRTKIDQVFLATAELDYDIYVFAETWLDDSIQSAQLFCNGYRVFRVDRCTTNSTRRRGGGVLIAVKRKYGSSAVQNLPVTTIELLWVKVTIERVELYICALYIPPDKSQDCSFMQLHFDAISAVDSTQNDASENALNRLLEQVDWSEIHRSDDVDSATDCFNRILLNCITQTVPRSRPPRKPAWSNPRLIKLRRKRSKFSKLYSL